MGDGAFIERSNDGARMNNNHASCRAVPYVLRLITIRAASIAASIMLKSAFVLINARHDIGLSHQL